MKRQIVASEAAPKAVGPYSQAVWAGDLLFCAGQIPLDRRPEIWSPAESPNRRPASSRTFADCYNRKDWISGTW